MSPPWPSCFGREEDDEKGKPLVSVGEGGGSHGQKRPLARTTGRTGPKCSLLGSTAPKHLFLRPSLRLDTMAGLGEGPCCDAAHGLESLARELQESAADPTLSSCCQRDLEEQAAVARLKARLAAEDRTNLRKQVAERVLLHRPPAQPPQLSLDEEDLESSDEDQTLGGCEGKPWCAVLEPAGGGRAGSQRLPASVVAR